MHKSTPTKKKKDHFKPVSYNEIKRHKPLDEYVQNSERETDDKGNEAEQKS